MAVNILNGNFVNQDYRNLENVNQDNMNNLSQNKDMQIAGYFYNYNKSTVASSTIQVGSICTGIGSICPYGQLSTAFGQQSLNSTTFTLYPGVIRFADQAVPYAGGAYTQNQAVRAVYTAGGGDGAGSPTDVTITVPGSTTKYYVVAVVDLTTTDAYTETFTCSIATTAISEADLIANQSLDNPTYVALFYIYTPDASKYYVGTDQFCATNYNVEPCAGTPQNGYITNPYTMPDSINVGFLSYNGLTAAPTCTGYYRTYSDGITKFIIQISGNFNGDSTRVAALIIIDLATVLTAQLLPYTTNTLFKYSASVTSEGTQTLIYGVQPYLNFFMTSDDSIVNPTPTVVSPSLSDPFDPDTPAYYIISDTLPYLGITFNASANTDSSADNPAFKALIEIELTGTP